MVFLVIEGKTEYGTKVLIFDENLNVNITLFVRIYKYNQDGGFLSLKQSRLFKPSGLFFVSQFRIVWNVCIPIWFCLATKVLYKLVYDL